MSFYYPEGRLAGTPQNRAVLANPAALADACRDGQILEARAVVCYSEHNLIVDLGCMKGIISRDESAIGIREGTVRDIAIISRVNRPVCFQIIDFAKQQDGSLIANLSRRAAQERCHREYLSTLRPGDVIPATVTHLEPFGVFADIGCGIIALMPIDTISVSLIHHPKERFQVGMEIRAVVKSIENNRITLSHKELLGTWEENAARFSPGETVAGIVRSVELYGIFVELAPNLAGLAELKENVKPGQQASVFIKSLIPEKMKVKLIIIDTFDEPIKPQTPDYYFYDNHMDTFRYSPANCEKQVLTIFE